MQNVPGTIVGTGVLQQEMRWAVTVPVRGLHSHGGGSRDADPNRLTHKGKNDRKIQIVTNATVKLEYEAGKLL